MASSFKEDFHALWGSAKAQRLDSNPQQLRVFLSKHVPSAIDLSMEAGPDPSVLLCPLCRCALLSPLSYSCGAVICSACSQRDAIPLCPACLDSECQAANAYVVAAAAAAAFPSVREAESLYEQAQTRFVSRDSTGALPWIDPLQRLVGALPTSRAYLLMAEAASPAPWDPSAAAQVGAILVDQQQAAVLTALSLAPRLPAALLLAARLLLSAGLVPRAAAYALLAARHSAAAHTLLLEAVRAIAPETVATASQEVCRRLPALSCADFTHTLRSGLDAPWTRTRRASRHLCSAPGARVPPVSERAVEAGDDAVRSTVASLTVADAATPSASSASCASWTTHPPAPCAAPRWLPRCGRD